MTDAIRIDDSATAYIALGANLGDAAHTLRVAFDELAQLPQTQLVATSSLYRSRPFGQNADGPDYINAVAQIQTELFPEQLLEALQGIEYKYGRERHYQNAPRTLDLDILYYDDWVFDKIWNDTDGFRTLNIPHPRMHERAFVLLPLAEIVPDLEWRDTPFSKQILQDLLPSVMMQNIEKL